MRQMSAWIEDEDYEKVMKIVESVGCSRSLAMRKYIDTLKKLQTKGDMDTVQHELESTKKDLEETKADFEKVLTAITPDWESFDCVEDFVSYIKDMKEIIKTKTHDLKELRDQYKLLEKKVRKLEKETIPPRMCPRCGAIPLKDGEEVCFACTTLSEVDEGNIH